MAQHDRSADTSGASPAVNSEAQASAGSRHQLSTASLVIVRAGGFVDAIRRYAVLVDGQQAALIANGETKTIPLEPGMHTVKLKIDWCGSNEVTFQLAAGETASFQCGPNLEGVPVLLGFFRVLFSPGRYLYLTRAEQP